MVKQVIAAFVVALLTIGCQADEQQTADTKKHSDGKKQQQLVYTDDRCRNAVEEGVICVALPQKAPIAELRGNTADFPTFYALNKEHLPEGATDATELPGMHVYLTKVKGQDS